MKKLSSLSKNTKFTILAAAAALLGLGAIQSSGASVFYNFADNTSDGWTLGGFSAGAAAPVVNIGGQNYISYATGGFQVGNVASGYTGNLATFDAAMGAALQNPAGYTLSYNWYVDTSTAGWSAATYAQLGFFVNAGSGFYAQSYGSPDEVQLDGTQTTSGLVYSGTVTVPFTVFGTDANAATESFFRLGIVLNSNGTGSAQFTDISINPTGVPEPTILGLSGLGIALSGMLLRRRLA